MGEPVVQAYRHGSGSGLVADDVSLHEPRRAFGVRAGFGEERAEVGAAGVGVERGDILVDLVQVEEVRVRLVRDDLEAMGTGLVREGVAPCFPGRSNEVVTVLRLDGEGDEKLIHGNPLRLMEFTD